MPWRWKLGILGLLVGFAPLFAASPEVDTPLRFSRPRIVFLSPNSEGNTYWPQVFKILDKVASDLDFEFVPYSFGVDDRFTRAQEAIRVLNTNPRPQAVIASVVIGHSKPLLEAAESLHIPVFVLGPLFPAELPNLGGMPRKKYTSWIAEFDWAEEEKGYALGKELLIQATKQKAFASDGTIQVVALGGDPSWFGSGLRQAGLARAMEEHPKAVLKQIVPTHWSQTEARRLATKLTKRFPEATVFWAASDQLGAGVVQAFSDMGRQPGVSVFTGGLDLSDLGLDLVKNRKFVATTASTMLSYAAVAILVYDFIQGRDFADQLGTKITFPTYVAAPANVDQHLLLSRCFRSIDFKTFSMIRNKRLQLYDFSLEAYYSRLGTCRDD